MADPQVSKEALQAVASMLGLRFTDRKMEDLLPQVRLSVNQIREMDSLNLDEIEPATMFKVEED